MAERNLDKHPTGRQPESAALRNAIRRDSSRTAELPSEEMIFGLGGGIGFAYFLFDMHGGHPVYIGTRVHTKETAKPEFLLTACEALGLTAKVQQSSSPAAARKTLLKNLSDGLTPVVWVEITRLPYMVLAGHANFYHTISVLEQNGDLLTVGDLAGTFEIRIDDLMAARANTWSPKFRSLVIEPAKPGKSPDSDVVARIRATCDQMLDGLGIANFGISGLTAWADMLTKTKHKKSWPSCFPPGGALHGALSSAFSQIELRGYGASGFRGMYADFLLEAAEHGAPKVRSAAHLFRESERQWGVLASSLLPEGVPLLQKTRELLLRRSRLLQEQGANAVDELYAIRDELQGLRTTAGVGFPMAADEVKELFVAIRDEVLRTEALERSAFLELRAAVA